MTGVEVHGTADPRFEGVRLAMEKNVVEGGDLGACAAVVYEGRVVADLWVGARTADGTRPWERDTIVNLWSTTKTVAALVVLMLHDRGALDIESPIASVWPEFAAAGKDRVRIRHALSHTAGLHEFVPPLGRDVMFDWDACCGRLAAQRPAAAPGAMFAYHAFTQGFLLGEVVRRVTGVTMGDWLRQEITGPHDVDFHLGVPAAAIGRVAETVTDAMPALAGPDRLDDVNTDRWRRAEFPSSNGHGNARSVARLLSMLTRRPALAADPVTETTIGRVRQRQWDGPCPVLGRHVTMGVGYGLSSAHTPLGVNEDTLWWGGLGGSMAVVDLVTDLVVVYAMNRMFDGPVGGLRGFRVVHAAHDALRPR